jgi:hypothetical protein
MDVLSWAILLLIATLAMHLVEEVRARFRQKFPLREIPKTFFIGINIFIYTFCLATFLLAVFNHGFAAPFAWAFAIAMLINGIGHIGMMIWKRKYFPGGLTSPLLIIVSAFLIMQLIA